MFGVRMKAEPPGFRHSRMATRKRRRRDVLDDIARDDDVEVVAVGRGELLEGRLEPLVQPVVGQDPGGWDPLPPCAPTMGFQPVRRSPGDRSPPRHPTRSSLQLRALRPLVKNVELVAGTWEQYGLRAVQHCHWLSARVAS